MSSNPCCDNIILGFVPGPMIIAIHSTHEPSLILDTVTLPDWHVNMGYSCAAVLLQPTTDLHFQPGYSLTRVTIMSDEQEIEIPLPHIIAPYNPTPYHFYYTANLNRFEHPNRFGAQPSLSFR